MNSGDVTIGKENNTSKDMRRIGYQKASKRFLSVFMIGCVTVGDLILILSGIFGRPPPTENTFIESTITEDRDGPPCSSSRNRGLYKIPRC